MLDLVDMVDGVRCDLVWDRRWVIQVMYFVYTRWFARDVVLFERRLVIVEEQLSCKFLVWCDGCPRLLMYWCSCRNLCWPDLNAESLSAYPNSSDLCHTD